MLPIRAVYFGLPVLHALLMCKPWLRAGDRLESAFLAARPAETRRGNGRTLPEEERQGAASAGVSATEGAFAGLRITAPSVRASATLEPELLVGGTTASVSTSSGGFAVGGMAQASGSAGLSADVGATASVKGRISFDAN